MERLESDLKRFEERYQEDANGCWIWTGSYNRRDKGEKGRNPSPVMSINNTNKTVTRWIYEVLNGPVPQGRVLRSICGNIKCVNPAHRQITHGKRIGQKKLPPIQGPKLPDKENLSLEVRLSLGKRRYRHNLQMHGAKCMDCGGIASIGAKRCRDCWSRKRKQMYAKNPEKMLRNRYRVWKARREYVSGTKQGSKAVVRETG